MVKSDISSAQVDIFNLLFYLCEQSTTQIYLMSSDIKTKRVESLQV